MNLRSTMTAWYAERHAFLDEPGFHTENVVGLFGDASCDIFGAWPLARDAFEVLLDITGADFHTLSFWLVVSLHDWPSFHDGSRSPFPPDPPDLGNLDSEIHSFVTPPTFFLLRPVAEPLAARGFETYERPLAANVFPDDLHVRTIYRVARSPDSPEDHYTRSVVFQRFPG